MQSIFFITPLLGSGWRPADAAPPANDNVPVSTIRPRPSIARNAAIGASRR